jgi:ribosomal protein S18 acetylase RimI-like enzyme
MLYILPAGHWAAKETIVPPIDYDHLKSDDLTPEVVRQLAIVLKTLTESGRVSKNKLGRLLASPNTQAFVARDHSEPDSPLIVGITIANVVYLLTGCELRIDEVAVLPAYQGRGIAPQLMSHAFGFGRRNGAKSSELTCAPRRDTAGKMYERLGYHQRATRVFERDL